MSQCHGKRQIDKYSELNEPRIALTVLPCLAQASRFNYKTVRYLDVPRHSSDSPSLLHPVHIVVHSKISHTKRRHDHHPEPHPHHPILSQLHQPTTEQQNYSSPKPSRRISPLLRNQDTLGLLALPNRSLHHASLHWSYHHLHRDCTVCCKVSLETLGE